MFTKIAARLAVQLLANSRHVVNGSFFRRGTLHRRVIYCPSPATNLLASPMMLNAAYAFESVGGAGFSWSPCTEAISVGNC